MSSVDEKSSIQAAMSDFAEGVSNWELWLTLGISDLKARYNRSLIGLIWITLGFACFIVLKIFIFGALSSMDSGLFAIHVTVGYFVWRFISSTLTNATTVFVTATTWISSEALPFSVYVCKTIFLNCVNMWMAIPPVLFVCYYYNGNVLMGSLMFIPAMVLYIANAFWFTIVYGIIGTRFRDVIHFTSAIMLVLYFASPILWVPSEAGTLQLAAKYNPLTYYIEIAREPFVSGSITWLNWQVSIALTAIGWIVALIAFSIYRRRIVFWL